MSRRPGIAANWFHKFQTDVYPADYVVLRGKKMKPPRYYDYLYELQGDDIEFVKYKRIDDAKLNVDNNTPERLNIRREVQELRLSQLKRTLL